VPSAPFWQPKGTVSVGIVDASAYRFVRESVGAGCLKEDSTSEELREIISKAIAGRVAAFSLSASKQ
jgi:hypothetical protein